MEGNAIALNSVQECLEKVSLCLDRLHIVWSLVQIISKEDCFQTIVCTLDTSIPFKSYPLSMVLLFPSPPMKSFEPQLSYLLLSDPFEFEILCGS